jgi:hypothetical protein
MYIGITVLVIILAFIAYGVVTGSGSDSFFAPEDLSFDPDRDTDREDVPGQGEV